jgi:hypothetical protein
VDAIQIFDSLGGVLAPSLSGNFRTMDEESCCPSTSGASDYLFQDYAGWISAISGTGDRDRRMVSLSDVRASCRAIWLFRKSTGLLKTTPEVIVTRRSGC